MIPDPLHTHLVTSDGRRIDRHPDDPLGTFRIPKDVTIVGWKEERFGSIRAESFSSAGSYVLKFTVS